MQQAFGLDAYSPREIAQRVEEAGVAKARLPPGLGRGAVDLDQSQDHLEAPIPSAALVLGIDALPSV